MIFSQFGGKYQRNLFTLIQTRRYLMVCVSLVFLENFVIIMLEVYRKELMKETQFIIYNILWIVLSDIFFGVYVPLKHIFLSRRTLPELWSEYGIVQTSRFYVSKQSFIPRRYVETENEGKASIFKNIKNQKRNNKYGKQSHNLWGNLRMTNVNRQITRLS